MLSRDVERSLELRRAEAQAEAFREALGPFVTAADTTRMPMVFTDAKVLDHPIIYANQSFLTLTGYDEHEVMEQSFDFLMMRGTDPEMLAEIQASFEGARDLEPLVRYDIQDAPQFHWLAELTPRARISEHIFPQMGLTTPMPIRKTRR